MLERPIHPASSARQSFPTPQPLTLLAGVLCLWALVYALLLPSYSHWNEMQQLLFRYSPGITLAGVALLVVAALHDAHPQQTRSYRGACWALLGVQLLNSLALVINAEPYIIGARVGIGQGILIYVLIYTVLLVSIFLLAPVWSLPRITLLRLTVENALVMATVDVLLRLLLPQLIPGWIWTPVLTACAFRLETTIGLFIWYGRIYRLFGPGSIPIGLWSAGFIFLTLNDAMVLWMSAFLEPGRTVVREAVPFWMVNQTLWGLALYRCRRIPLRWEAPARPLRATPSRLIWLAPLRRAALLVGLTLTVAFAPSVISMAWFVVALIGRELLASYEQQRLERAEHEAQAALVQANADLLAANQELQRRHAIEADLAAERARSAMARDIHDSLGSHLHGVLTMASTLARHPSVPPDLQPMLVLLSSSVADAHREMRRAITILRPRVAAENPQPLEQALAGSVEDARHYGLPVVLELRGKTPPVPVSTANELALVVREALTNAHKYAQATEVRVVVDYTDPATLVLIIADNGIGMQIPSSPRPAGTGNGMGNMRARVEALGGTLELPPTERGVTLWIRIPQR